MFHVGADLGWRLPRNTEEAAPAVHPDPYPHLIRPSLIHTLAFEVNEIYDFESHDEMSLRSRQSRLG